MKFKKGVPCPVAALARSDKCLAGDCGWYLKDPGSCLIAVQAAAMNELIDEVQALREAIDKMGPGLDEALKLLKEVKEGAV